MHSGFRLSKRQTMTINVKELSSLALRLPEHSRAMLVGLLLDSLDEGSVESCGEAWLAVAAKRDGEMENGSARSVDHREIVESARRAVRCAR